MRLGGRRQKLERAEPVAPVQLSQYQLAVPWMLLASFLVGQLLFVVLELNVQAKTADFVH